jgi:hypothetical protein
MRITFDHIFKICLVIALLYIGYAIQNRHRYASAQGVLILDTKTGEVYKSPNITYDDKVGRQIPILPEEKK